MSCKTGAASLVRLAKACVVAFAGVAAVGWSSALMADSGSKLASAEAVNHFNMQHVERIRVRVWGNADLTGEYSIDHNSSLSFAGLGRIEVGGMTPAELEQMLSKRLGALTRAEVIVSVDVEQFRPFYIMGHVAEPGAIAWRPGLKVIQAVTLARGVMRSADSLDPNSARDRTLAHDQSQTRLTFALAQIARYRAELEGADVVAANQRIATLVSSAPESSRAALTGLINRQNEMLTEQRDAMRTQILGLQREREAAEREVAAAETQEKAVTRQVDITRELLADIENLWKRKLVSRSRYLDQRTALLTAEVRAAEANSMVERARARLILVDQQTVTLPQQRRIALNDRIDELEREVAQLELASLTREDSNDALKLAYSITRETSTGVETFAANIFTQIVPGDVLTVSDGPATGSVTQPGKILDMPAEGLTGVSDARDLKRVRDEDTPLAAHDKIPAVPSLTAPF